MIEALDEVIHLIVQANRVLRDAGEQLAAVAGLTHSQRMVLQTMDGSRTMADIARILGLARQGVRRTADELVSEGLASYQPNPRHKRANLLELTPKGAAALQDIRNAQQKWIEHVALVTPQVEWIALKEPLEHLIAAVISGAPNQTDE